MRRARLNLGGTVQAHVISLHGVRCLYARQSLELGELILWGLDEYRVENRITEPVVVSGESVSSDSV